MAVIQISKIQIRRGKKLTGNGVPQLSSAEFAWAVDTQELYIGNGSLAEGAPYVGNTKILTEHDNILELADSYRFAENDLSVVNSVFRSLQTKIDEIEVSVVDFGAVPDGSFDCAPAFEAAFANLFLKEDDRLKKVLKIPNGVYVFFSDLKIPSRAILRGENQRETVLEIGNNNIIFVSENGTLPGAFTSTDLPHDIRLENFTIDHQEGQTITTSSQNCIFDKVIWRGSYLPEDAELVPQNANGLYVLPIISAGGSITVLGPGGATTVFTTNHIVTINNLVAALNDDSTFSSNFEAERIDFDLRISTRSPSDAASLISSSFTVEVLSSGEFGTDLIEIIPVLSEFSDGLDNSTPSIYWSNYFFGTRSTDNHFIHCGFYNSRLAVKCEQDEPFETRIYFDGCRFFNCGAGIYVKGSTDFTVIPTVYQENRWKIENTDFQRMTSRALTFTEGVGTQIVNCTFTDCGNGLNSSQYPEVSLVKFGQPIDNVVIDCSSDRHRLSGITNQSTAKGHLEYEGSSLARIIDRNYSQIFLSDAFRPLAVFSSYYNSITVDYVLILGSHTRTGIIQISVNGNKSSVSMSDNYTYSSGGSSMINFQFDAELRNNDSDAGNETILLNYKNPLPSITGSISYSLSYGV